MKEINYTRIVARVPEELKERLEEFIAHSNREGYARVNISSVMESALRRFLNCTKK